MCRHATLQNDSNVSSLATGIISPPYGGYLRPSASATFEWRRIFNMVNVKA
jgi:hypothetical protein